MKHNQQGLVAMYVILGSVFILLAWSIIMPILFMVLGLVFINRALLLQGKPSLFTYINSFMQDIGL